jgi:hypothetical protein
MKFTSLVLSWSMKKNTKLAAIKINRTFQVSKSYNYGYTFLDEDGASYTECHFFPKLNKEYIEAVVDNVTCLTLDLLSWEGGYEVITTKFQEQLKQAEALKPSNAKAFFDLLIEELSRLLFVDVGIVKLTPEDYKSLSIASLKHLLKNIKEEQENENIYMKSEKQTLVELIAKHGLPETWKNEEKPKAKSVSKKKTKK